MNEATKIMRKLYVFAEDEQGNAYYSQICDEHFATFFAGLASSCAPFIPFAAQFFCDYEILGNIHDNPELLK